MFRVPCKGGDRVTAWLIRRFVKNSQDVQNGEVRAAYGTLGASVGIGLNALLSLMKFLLGIFTGSLAITADAANNLSDAFGSVVSLVTVRMARKPMDREHPFGHGRMEYIGSLMVGALIVVMGLTLLREGIGGILHPGSLMVSVATLALLGISVLGKLWLSHFYRKLGRATENSTLLAAAKDSISDVAATGAVLVSVGVQSVFGWQVDGYMGVLVALFVLKTGAEVCRSTVGLLLGEKPDPEKLKQIEELLLSYEGILGIHDLIVHDYGPGRRIASVHAEVSAQGNIVAVHELIDKAEREIGDRLNMVICIHMDPVVTDDPAANELKQQLIDFLRHLDERLSLHDFRMVPGQEQIRLIFDCVLPSGYTDREGLLRSLGAYVKTLDPRYALVVQFDTEFC